jgi:hypothetical protein
MISVFLSQQKKTCQILLTESDIPNAQSGLGSDARAPVVCREGVFVAVAVDRARARPGDGIGFEEDLVPSCEDLSSFHASRTALDGVLVKARPALWALDVLAGDLRAELGVLLTSFGGDLLAES